LYVLNAHTGALEKKIATLAGGSNVGTAATPSGFGKITAWVDSAVDNTAKRFYGGDLLGNIWRVDVDELLEPKGKALQLATLSVGGKLQPITTKPQLAEIRSGANRYAAVYVGTGKYLGTNDPAVVDTQSVYGIKDSLGAEGLGDVVAGGTLVNQTLAADGSKRVTDNNPVDWDTRNGWRVNLPDAGERVNVDMLMAFDSLAVPANIPGAAATACNAAGGGKSWLYYFDIASGRATGKFMGEALTVGITEQLGCEGKCVTDHLVDSTGHIKDESRTPRTSGLGNARRTSWRELIN
jgi:type IV pilus assembly protein PilY1